MKPPQKTAVSVLASQEGLEIGKNEDKQPKHFSRWQPPKGALLDFGSQLFCVEVWKIFCEDCFLFALQLKSVLV